MSNKLYVPCDDCKFDEDSPDCQRCEFEQALNDNLAKDAEIERLKKLSKGNDTCLLELGEICGNIAAKDEEIERLRKQWTGVPDEYANWEEFGQALLEDNDQLTEQCLERGEEIEQLRTAFAEERRLKDEARRGICELEMMKRLNETGGARYYTKRDIAKERDWDYLYEKEQAK